MWLKVGDEYLAEVDVDVEKQVKLFEEATNGVNGDRSFDFTIPATTKILSTLGLESINNANKRIYSKVSATIEAANGITLYRGFLKTEKKRGRKEVDCTFYSGNSEWISLLPDNVRDVDLSEYDEDFTVLNIQNSWISRSGIFYPLLNTGSFTSRSYRSMKLEDFKASIYVKDVIQKMFAQAGLKINGTILNDFRYQRMVTTNNDNSIPQDEENNRKTFVAKETGQTIPADSSDHTVTFPTTTGTYFPGDLWNTGTDRFTADVRMIVDVTFTVNVTIVAGNVMVTKLHKNGALYGDTSIIIGGVGSAVTGGTKTLTIRDVELSSTDYLEVVSKMAASSVDDGTINTSKLTITPNRIYYTYARSLVPNWSGKDFLYNVITPFNPLVTYDEYSKTVTIDLFKDLQSKPDIDISRYIDPTTIEEDYTEFIQNYGTKNRFLYSEPDEDDVKRYNRNNTIPYAGGELDSENENIAPIVDVVTLDFTPVMETNINPFSVYLPKLNYTEVEDDFDDSATITNSSGEALFTVGASHGFQVNDLVRVSESTVDVYNGEWVVTATAATTIKLRGVEYEANGSATVTKLNIQPVEDSNQIILIAVTSQDVGNATAPIIGVDDVYLDEISKNAVGTAYFDKPLQGLDIDEFKKGLSFGDISILNSHQHNFLDDYWKPTEKILQDPLMLKAEARLPLAVFESLDFRRPLRYNDARFYLNRVSGYKEGHLPCLLEMIKF